MSQDIAAPRTLKTHGAGRKTDKALLIQKLTSASSAELIQVAQYSRPKWRTITVAAFVQDSWEASFSSNTGMKEAGAILRDIEVLESSSLSDVRKLIAAFCPDVPQAFEFAELHRLSRPTDEEKCMCIDEVLEDNRVTVLYQTEKAVRSRTLADLSEANASPAVQSSSQRPNPASRPAFSLVRQFGDFHAAADIFLKKMGGLTIQLHSFSNDGNRMEGTSTSERAQVIAINLDARALAERVSMTANTVQVLMSSSRGQTNLLQKILVHLELTGSKDDASEPIRWRWSSLDSAVDTDDVQLSRVKRAPVKVEREIPVKQPAEEKQTKSLPEKQLSKKQNQASVKSSQDVLVAEEKPLPRPAPSKAHSFENVEANPLSRLDKKVAHAASAGRSTEPTRAESAKALSKEVFDPESLKTLRLCLGFTTKSLGKDLPPNLIDQIVFTELMLRNFCSSTLASFVKEVRRSLREVLRSCFLLETLPACTSILWAGLRVALWDEKITSFADKFRTEALTSVEGLQEQFVKARFEGFEAPRLPVLPRSIATLLLCLELLANGSDNVYALSVEDTVESLGLNNLCFEERKMQVFRVISGFGSERSLLSKRCTRKLSELLEDLADSMRLQPFTAEEEALYNASLLARIAVALFSFAEFDLCRSVQLKTDNGESPRQIESLLRSVLQGPDSSPTSSSLDERARRMGDVYTDFFGNQEVKIQAPQARPMMNKVLQPGENPRWRKVDNDCHAIAACPRHNCRFRWFIEPNGIQQERFIFPGEDGLMFEWIYMDSDTTSCAECVETSLVKRALVAWSSQPREPDTSSAFSSPAKIAFGVNFRHVDKIESTTFPATNQLLAKFDCVESMVFGCCVGDEDSPNVVVMRAYSSTKQSNTHPLSLENFQDQLLQNQSLLQQTLRQGGLSFLRMCALREVARQDSVLSMLYPIHSGGSSAEKVIKAAIAVCASSPELLLSQQVSHFVLFLALHQRISVDLTTQYLFGVLTLLKNADQEPQSAELVSDFANQVFVYASDGILPSPTTRKPDVYDIFWGMSTSELLDPSCREACRSIAIRAFFLPRVMNKDRILRYSLLISLNRKVVDTILQILRGQARYPTQLRLMVAKWVCNISEGVQRDPELRKEVTSSDLVSGLLEVIWDLEEVDIGASVIHALATFQMCNEFRLQVTMTLIRLSSQSADHRDSILEEIIPSHRRLEDTDRVRPLFKFIAHQHTRIEPCQCFNDVRLDGDARNAIISSYARKFAGSMISRALKSGVSRATCGAGGLPRQLQSLAIKVRKAAKIQRGFLRWLYMAKKGAGVLSKVDKWWICDKCKHTPSFLAGIVICLRQSPSSFAILNAEMFRRQNYGSASAIDSPVMYVSFIEGAVSFIRQMSREETVCAVLSQVFKIEYALLKLTFHDSQVLRRCAIRALAELCWRSKSSMKFVCSRLNKSIWDNRDFSFIRQKQDKKFCPWIEFIIRLVLERFKLSFADGALGAEGSVENVQSLSSGVKTGPVLNDIDAVSSLLLVLSYEPENSTIIMKIIPTVAKNLSKWISGEHKYLHLRFLAAMQNALLMSVSMVGMETFADAVVSDLRFFLQEPAGVPFPMIAKALVLGIIWSMCLSQNVRKVLTHRYSDLVVQTLMSAIAAPMDAKTQKNGPSPDVQIAVSSAVGVLATMSTEGHFSPMEPSVLNALGDVYTHLQPPAAEAKQTASESAPIHRDMRTPCPIFNDSIARNVRFGVCPLFASFRAFWCREEFTSHLREQISRLFGTIAFHPGNSEMRRIAAQYYFQNFSHQTGEQRSGIDFALKTVPLIYRSCNEAKLLDGCCSDIPAKTLTRLLLQMQGDRHDEVSVGNAKMTKRIVVALRNLYLSFGNARSAVQELQKHLLMLLHSQFANDKLRIAILGLLAMTVKPKTAANSAEPGDGSDPALGDETGNIPVDSFDSSSRVSSANLFATVLNVFPLIIRILSAYKRGNPDSVLCSAKKWSPLLLDSNGSSPFDTGDRNPYEVIKSIRWPVELLFMLHDSAAAQHLALQGSDLEVLIQVLSDLDCRIIQEWPHAVYGRQELVLQVSKILRSFTKRHPLTKAMALRCLNILSGADVMMSYTNELAFAVCGSLSNEECLGAFVLPESRSVVQGLGVISKYGCQTDLYNNMLDFLCTMARHMDEAVFVTQVEVFEAATGQGIGVIGDRVLSLFSISNRGLSDWALAMKAFEFLYILVRGALMRSRILAGIRRKFSTTSHQPGDEAHIKDSFSAKLSVSSTGMSNLLMIAFQMLSFRFWMDTSMQDVVMQACLAGSKVAVSLLREICSGADHNATAGILRAVSVALMQDHLHHPRIVSSSTSKEPLGALCHVLTASYFHAQNSRWRAYATASTIREMQSVFVNGLAHLAACHDACHSKQLTKFVMENAENPVFLESNPATLLSILRVYRLCCCNSHIYRILRLGSTPLWDLSGEKEADEDDSYFRRLGRTFATHKLAPAIQWEIVLLLWHQFYVFPSLTPANRKTSTASSKQSQARVAISSSRNGGHSRKQSKAVKDDIISSIDTDTLNSKIVGECLHDQFQLPYGTSRIVSHGARDFESGLVSELHRKGKPASSAIEGEHLINALIELMLKRIKSSTEEEFEPCRSVWIQELEQVFGMVDQLAKALSSQNAKQDAQEGSIHNTAIKCILYTVRDFRFDGVTELTICFKILQQYCHERSHVKKLVGDFEVAEVLASRLGQSGVGRFGLASCQCTLDFVLFLADRIENEQDRLQFCCNPVFVCKIFELLDLDWTLAGAAGVAKSSIAVLRFFSRPSSSEQECDNEPRCTATRCVMKALEDESSIAINASRATQPAVSLGVTNVPRSYLHILTQLLVNSDGLRELGSPIMEMLCWFMIAEPAIMLQKLLGHNVLPILCNLVHTADTAIQTRAVEILNNAVQSARARNDQRIISALGNIFTGSQRPFYDGHLASILSVKQFEEKRVALETKRARADSVKILDLLRRLTLFSRISAEDLILLSQIISLLRFQHGEQIVSEREIEHGVFIVVSGDVAWTLVACHPPSSKRKPKHLECSLGKGCAFGYFSSSLLGVKGNLAWETASAANEVVCLLIPERLWTAPESEAERRMAENVQHAAKNASGVVFHLGKQAFCIPELRAFASKSYMRKLKELALGESSGDVKLLEGSIYLLAVLCRQYRRRVEANTLCADQLWVLQEFFVLLSKDTTPTDLRREIIHLALELTRGPSEGLAQSVLTNWRQGSGCCGLVVLAKGFLKCAADMESLQWWLQCAVNLMRPSEEALGKTVVRTLSEGALLHAFTAFLALTNGLSSPSLLVWDYLHFLACITESPIGRSRIVSCVPLSDRVEVCRQILALAKAFAADSSHENEFAATRDCSLLRFITNLSRHDSLKESIWSLPEWELDITSKLDQLHQLTREKQGSLTKLALLEFLCNILESTAASDSAKTRIIAWMSESLKLDEYVISLLGSCSYLEKVQAAVLSWRVLHVFRVLSRSKDAIPAPNAEVELVLKRCVGHWAPELQQHFIYACTDGFVVDLKLRLELLRGLKIAFECSFESMSDDGDRDDSLLELMGLLRREQRKCSRNENNGDNNVYSRYVTGVLGSIAKGFTGSNVEIANVEIPLTLAQLDNLMLFSTQHGLIVAMKGSKQCRRDLHSELVLQRSTLAALHHLLARGVETTGEDNSRRLVQDALVGQLLNMLARLNGSFPASIVRIAGACLTEVLRDGEFVSKLTTSSRVALMTKLCGTLRFRVALRAKVLSFWYLCRVVRKENKAHHLRSINPAEWIALFGTALAIDLDASGRLLCYQGKIVNWIVEQFGSPAFEMVSGEDVEAMVRKFLGLVEVSEFEDGKAFGKSHATTGLKVIFATIRTYHQLLNADLIMAYTRSTVRIILHIVQSPSGKLSDQHGSLLQLCLESIRDLRMDPRYCKDVESTMARHTDVLLGFDEVFNNLQARGTAFCIAVYDFTALVLSSADGVSKHSLQIELAKQEGQGGDASWIVALQHGMLAEKARVAKCIRLLCEGNPAVLQAYIAPQSQLVLVIRESLGSCVAPALAPTMAPPHDISKLRDVCEVITHSCAILQELLAFEASTLKANVIDTRRYLSVVVPILHLMTQKLEENEILIPDWNKVARPGWVAAISAMLHLVHAILKHRINACCAHTRHGSLMTTLFLSVRQLELGEQAVYIALRSLQRVLSNAKASSCQGRNSELHQLLQVKELFDEHAALLLKYADFGSTHFQLKPKLRVAALQAFHALSGGVQRFQDQAPVSNETDQLQIVLCNLLRNFTPSVAADTVADLIELSLETTPTDPSKTAELFSSSWTLIADTPSHSALTSRRQQKRQAYVQLCAFTALVHLTAKAKSRQELVQNDCRGFWSRYVALYDFARANREFAMLEKLVALVVILFSLEPVSDQEYAMLSAHPVDLMERLLVDVNSCRVKCFVPAIITFCGRKTEDGQHILSSHQRECLEILPRSVRQMAEEHERHFLQAVLCHLSLVTEILAAAVHDNWQSAVHDCIDPEQRSIIGDVISQLLKIKSRIDPPTKVLPSEFISKLDSLTNCSPLSTCLCDAQAIRCLYYATKFGWHKLPENEISPASDFDAAIAREGAQQSLAEPRLLYLAFSECASVARASLKAMSASGLRSSTVFPSIGEPRNSISLETTLQTISRAKRFSADVDPDGPFPIQCFEVVLHCMVELIPLPSFACEFKHRTDILSKLCAILELDTSPSSVTRASLMLLLTMLRGMNVYKEMFASTIDLTVFFRLLHATTSSDIVGWVYQCVWSLLRNREIRARFVVRLVSQSSSDLSQVDPFLHENNHVPHFLEIDVVRKIKDAIYSSDLDDRGQEAAYGILALLAKSATLHDALLQMDELLSSAVFSDDRWSLLSVVVPSSSESVLAQQSKFVLHICQAPSTVPSVLAKLNVLRVLQASILTNNPVVCASACQALEILTRHPVNATRAQLRDVRGNADVQDDHCLRHLHTICKDNDFDILRAVHKILASAIDAETQGIGTADARKAVCACIRFFDNISTSRNASIRLRSVLVETTTGAFVRLLLLFVVTTIGEDAFSASKRHHQERDMLARVRAIHVLQFVTKSPQVTALFGIHAPSHMELLDLLFLLLHHLMIATVERWSRSHAQVIVLETMLLIQNITHDVQASTAIVARVDGLGTLFHYLSPNSSVAVSKVFWDIMCNFGFHGLGLVKLGERISLALRENIVYPELISSGNRVEVQSLVSVMMKTLRKITEKSTDSHESFLKLLPALSRLLVSEDSLAVLTPSSLENIALMLSRVTSACKSKLDEFTEMLDLIERLISTCEVQHESQQRQSEKHTVGVKDTLEITSGVKPAIERLVGALCELLAFFHEEEAKSVLPGYRQLRVEELDRPNFTVGSLTKQKSLFSKFKLHRSVQPISSRKHYSLICKKMGVFCLGYSPLTLDLHEQILRTFESACTFRVDLTSSHRSFRADISSAGHCTAHVIHFHYQISTTVTGRYMLLHPIVISFWRKLLPQMNRFQLHLLCKTLLNCALSKIHTLVFLTCGGAKVLVQAVVEGIQKTETTKSAVSARAPDKYTADAFFLIFIQCAAVLSERSTFLQSTYYMVHAGEKDGITIGGLVLAAIVYSKGCSAYLLLASKLLARLLSLFSLNEAEGLFANCGAQIARTLKWQVSSSEIAHALLTTIHHTESEGIMKTRVVVKVIHSTLLRTAVLGLIDKGIPEVLHDFGLIRMVASMEKLRLHCKSFDLSARAGGKELSRSVSVASPVTRGRRPSLTSSVMAPIERWTGGGHMGAGIPRHDSESQTLLGSGNMDSCVDALKELTAEIAQYTMTNFKAVFESFESVNDDLELVEAMKSSSDAITFAQTTFYSMALLQEALIAALLSEVPTGEQHNIKGVTEKNVNADAATGDAALTEDVVAIAHTVELFLEKVEQLVEWIVISLQHSDIDLLFYATQLETLFDLTRCLFAIPIDMDQEDISAKGKDEEVNGAPADSTDSSHKKHGSTPKSGRIKQRAARRNIVPLARKSTNRSLYICFSNLEICSWLWSVLGFLPYLKVVYHNEVRLVRFTKNRQRLNSFTTSSHSSSARLEPSSSGGFRCRFDTVDTEPITMETMEYDLPHAVDVEVWIYLPFWYSDVLIGRRKVPVLAKYIDDKPSTWEFSSASARGVRAHTPDVLGTLEMELRSSLPACVNDVDHAFPAYSTLGSRKLRHSLRKVGAVLLDLVKGAFSSVAKFIQQENKKRNRRKSSHQLKNPDAAERTMELSTAESVEVIMTQILDVLRQSIHPDKLVGSYEKHNVAAECELLMEQLEKLAGGFTKVLIRGFQTQNKSIWRKLAGSFGVVRSCYLQSGLSFFSSHFQHGGSQAQASPPLTTTPTTPVGKAVLRRRNSPLTGSFRSFAQGVQAHKKHVFREVSSQIRFLDAHFKEDEKLDFDRKNLNQAWGVESATGLLPLSKTIHQLTSSDVVSRMKKATRFSQSDGDERLAARASAHLHNSSLSSVQWRMLLPHVSLWNLSQERVSEWHSYSHMIAPTSLSHFLVQPMERLQMYCAILRYLQPICNNTVAKNVALNSTASGEPPPTSSSRTGSASSRILSFKMPRSTRGASDGAMGGTKSKDSRSSASTHSVEEGVFALTSAAIASTPTASLVPTPNEDIRGPSVAAPIPAKISRFARFKKYWEAFLAKSEKSTIALVQNTFLSSFTVEDCRALEIVRARQLMKYHMMDPFDGAARLARLYHDAQRFPAILYREGKLGSFIYSALWVLLAVTVWRISVARDAVRDSSRSFKELYASQSNGDDWDEPLRNLSSLAGGTSSDDKQFIVISDRYNVHYHHPQTISHSKKARQGRGHYRVHDALSSAVLATEKHTVKKKPNDSIRISEQELKHFVILLEVQSLFSDIVRIWPIENGNIGLWGFWSSLLFTTVAIGSPFLFLYVFAPWMIAKSAENVQVLSYYACVYGFFWIALAFGSIVNITRNIPAFLEVRRVNHINLTTFPFCVRNYLAILSVIWECFQLNTTSFSVWEMSYQPKRIAALTTIDLQDIGLGFVQVNVFAIMQRTSLLCLVLWCFCLKASNKFKSFQWLNYLLTFLLPNFLGGLLFMFLSKQFYLSTACELNDTGETVLLANDAIHCWRDMHLTYALRGMFGMSIFVPLAVLAFGSYQVFFPELKLDVQTSPLLNVSSQIVKAAMMGALTFFVKQVRIFLGVALVGNLLLLALVMRYPLACSTWHLKYAKIFIYSLSSWSALCAMISTLVPASEKDSIPLYAMHTGWLLMTLALALAVRRKRRWLASAIASKSIAGARGRQSILVHQQTTRMKAQQEYPQQVLPEPSQQLPPE